MGLFSSRSDNCSKGDGHCHECRWWQPGESRGTSDRFSLGMCMHMDLVHFNLEVSGESGCNRFEPALAMAGAEAESVPAFMPSFA